VLGVAVVEDVMSGVESTPAELELDPYALGLGNPIIDFTISFPF
jgi:hypothetical protein